MLAISRHLPFALLHVLVALAAGEYTAVLDGDVLTVSNGWFLHTTATLGGHQSLYDPEREDEHVWRRVGKSGQTDVAVLVRQRVFGAAPELDHIALIGTFGHLELERDGETWLSHDTPATNLTAARFVARRLEEETFKSKVVRRLEEETFKWGGKPFEKCWPGQETGMRAMKIGLAYDDSLMAVFNNDIEKVQKFMENVLNCANIIYENQLGIHVSINKHLLKADFDIPQLGVGELCTKKPMTIQEKLEAFALAGKTKLGVYNLGAWMMMTNCYPPPGTVGLAYVSQVCDRVNGFGVTTLMSTPGAGGGRTWHTFTHELGHILGAQHSFENGMGKTGGIMDYGDGNYQGAYQFNPLRFKDLCPKLTQTMGQPRYSEVPNCWTTWDPQTDQDKVGSWIIGEWGRCDIDCKPNEATPGTMQRAITCRRTKEGAVLDPKNCNEKDFPKNTAVSQPCKDVPLCGDAPRFVYGPFGECTSDYKLPCGTGTQMREANCSDKNGVNLGDVTLCGVRKNDEKKECIIGKCPNRYSWVQHPTDYAKAPDCTFTGKGYEMKKIICLDTQFMVTAKDLLCIGSKQPADSREVPVTICKKVDNKCCLDASCLNHTVEGECEFGSTLVDAVVCVPYLGGRGYMYQFHGKLVRKMLGCDLKSREGTLSYMASFFKNLPADWVRIDAAVAGPSDYSPELLMFRGSQVVRWNLLESKMVSGFPKEIAEEFPGLTKSCPQCAEKVVTGLFDEVSKTFRFWCAEATTYCVGHRQWQMTETSEWKERPTQDFGLTQVRSAMTLTSGETTILTPVSVSCSIKKGTSLPAHCTNDGWWTEGPFGSPEEKGPPCAQLSFCTECDSAETTCKVCDTGFVVVDGRCINYQARIWFRRYEDFLATATDAGAKGSGNFIEEEGPFQGTKALRPLKQLDMGAAKKTEGSSVPGIDSSRTDFNKWSVMMWVKRKSDGTVVGDSEPLLQAKQSSGTFKITWNNCGPGVESEGRSVFSCGTLADAPVDKWVYFAMQFSNNNLLVEINGQKLRMEANIPPLKLESWALGHSNESFGHTMQIGFLGVLDHEIWPKVTFANLTDGSKALFVLGAVWALVCIALIVAVFFVGVGGKEAHDPVWWHIMVEVYVIVMNILFAVFGIFVMVGDLVTLATQEIGIGDLFSSGLIHGDLQFLMYPFWLGLGTFAVGCCGVRTARTRNCAALSVYMVFLVVGICGSIAMWVKLSDTELGLSGGGGVVGEAATMGNDLYYKARAPFMNATYKTYVSLVGPSNYDCDLTEGQTGDCAAVLGGAPIMECKRPHPAARAFQNLVNKYCVDGVNSSGCGKCLEVYGERAQRNDWDPTAPLNKVFCRCKTAAVDIAVKTVKSANWVVRIVVLSAVLLLVAEIVLLCFVPSKRELMERYKPNFAEKSEWLKAKFRRQKIQQDALRRTQMQQMEMMNYNDSAVEGGTDGFDPRRQSMAHGRQSMAHGPPSRMSMAQAHGRQSQAQLPTARATVITNGRQSQAFPQRH